MLPRWIRIVLLAPLADATLRMNTKGDTDMIVTRAGDNTADIPNPNPSVYHGYHQGLNLWVSSRAELYAPWVRMHAGPTFCQGMPPSGQLEELAQHRHRHRWTQSLTWKTKENEGGRYKVWPTFDTSAHRPVSSYFRPGGYLIYDDRQDENGHQYGGFFDEKKGYICPNGEFYGTSGHLLGKLQPDVSQIGISGGICRKHGEFRTARGDYYDKDGEYVGYYDYDGYFHPVKKVKHGKIFEHLHYVYGSAEE